MDIPLTGQRECGIVTYGKKQSRACTLTRRFSLASASIAFRVWGIPVRGCDCVSMVDPAMLLFFDETINFWGCFVISSNSKDKEMLINEQIRHKEVRVIDSDGSQLGILPIREALEKAAGRDMDLVLIAPQATPPACRIMDYGKFLFEKAKREKEARKNQKTIEIKEVRLSPNIDTHDFNTKLNHALRFLQNGDKVKVSIRFRGREMAHTKLGEEIMVRFAEACAEIGTVEKAPKLEGRNMLMFIAAKNTK